MAPNQQQKNVFALSMFSNVGNDNRWDEGKIRDVINTSLTKASSTIGSWKIAWGPAVKSDLAGFPVHTMYVAQSMEDTKQYVIAIAGTSLSLEDQVDDMSVQDQVNWKPGGPTAMISNGTAIGLSSLQSMKPSGDRAGANTTLQQFLTGIVGSGVKVMVTGHSLGGALAGTLALFLHDIQMAWDFSRKVALSSMTTAGPTAGNADFAAYSDTTLGSNLTRFANSLDLVPLAWDVSTLSTGPNLYETAGITDDFVTCLINDILIPAVKDGNYKQVQASAAPIPGSIFPSLTTYMGQMAYQHIQGYWGAFGYDDIWTGYTLSGGQESAIAASAPAIRLALKAAKIPIPKELAAVGARGRPRRS